MAIERSPSPLLGSGTAGALTLGALGCVQLSQLPPLWVCTVMIVLGMAGWGLRWRGRLPAVMLLGAGWTSMHGHWAMQDQLPPGQPARDVVVSGRVIDLPDHRAAHTRFLLQVSESRELPSLRGKRLQVTWNDGWQGRSSAAAEGRRRQVLAGAQWQLALRVRAPRSRINPGGFDSERHALLRGVAGTGTVRAPASARELQAGHGLPAWRERTSAAIALQVAHPAARFVQALALGDTRGLSDTDWDQLRALGLTHLVAISGFHVGVVAGLGALLCRGLWWLCPLLARHWPRPQAAACAAALSAAGYAVLAGGELPTVRTALMIGLVALARSGRRPLGLVQGLALAALALLLPAPLSVLSAGFWLSFGGVLWLVWCLPQGRPRGVAANLRGFLAAQGVASVGLLPLGIALFGGTAWLGPLVNLPVIPWWTLLVVPLSLLGTALQALHDGAGRWAWRAAAWLFEISWQALQPLAAHPQAMWWLAEAPAWAVPAALLGVFWWLLPRGAGGWLACCCACRCCGRRVSARPRGSWSCWCMTSARARRCCCVLRGMPSGTTWGRRTGARAASGSWFRHCGPWARRRPSGCCSATTISIMPATCRACVFSCRGCHCWRRREVRSPGPAVASAACAGTGMASISRCCTRMPAASGPKTKTAACCAWPVPMAWSCCRGTSAVRPNRRCCGRLRRR